MGLYSYESRQATDANLLIYSCLCSATISQEDSMRE